MEIELDARLQRIRAAIAAEAWERRLAEARQRAPQWAKVHKLVEGGRSVSAAIREVFPEASLEGHQQIYRRYRKGGVAGLIDRRWVQHGVLTPRWRFGVSSPGS